MSARDEHGVALVTALLILLLMGALAGALALTTSLETALAGNYRRLEAARAAAEAVLERALVDLAAATDWTPALAGDARASFADGPPSGVRVLPDGERVDLDRLVSGANCRRLGPCSAADLAAVTSSRPWGADNPVWRPYAYGPLDALDPAMHAAVPIYVVAMIGDDPSEIDDDPLVDGGGAGQEGLGRVVLRGYALGSGSTMMAVQAIVVRVPPNGVQIVSWTIQPVGL